MSFSPASLLSDRTRVWVAQGSAQGQTAQSIAAQYAAQYSTEGHVGSLAHPFSGTKTAE